MLSAIEGIKWEHRERDGRSSRGWLKGTSGSYAVEGYESQQKGKMGKEKLHCMPE